MKKYYLAIDLGATSGRHILSYEENGELILKEVHRFLTGMKESENGLVWDIPNLYNEILLGIKKAFEVTPNIESLSIDSWGVDYVLLNNDKEILPFYAYRNARLDNMYKNVHEIISFEELYKKTGIQFATFNSIYQFYADKLEGRLAHATDYLNIPEYFIYKLTGVKTHEYTMESTGGLLNCEKKDYDQEIIAKLGLPKELFTSKILTPGTTVGKLKDDVSEFVGGNLNVILCPSHDTGSAFEAVDCPSDSVIISSGTWSLIGVKNAFANTTLESMRHNFTNEGGVNYYRYLKNIMGMWIVNEISRQYNIDIPTMCQKLDNVEYKEIFDVNDQSLLNPKDMKVAVTNLLKHNPPKDDYELFASCYHSLAYSYDLAVKELEELNKTTYKSIYIVGGGAKNKYLNNLVKQYTKKEVIALPIEATAIGNIKTQIKK